MPTFPSTRHVRTAIVGVAAVVAVVLSGCTSAPAEPTATPLPRPALTLSIGALLPQTGSLAAFGPAAQAGVDLAVQEINDADVGLTITTSSQDAGDATADVATASTTTLIDSGVSVIIGALSDGVSKKVIDQIVNAGVVQISPGNVSLDFSRYADDNLYWRTAPSCAREGAALGEQIARSGAQSLGIVYQSGYCEPGLPEALADAFEREGGTVVSRVAFDAASTTLSAEVAEVVAGSPAAVAVLTPTLAKLAVPDLAAAGFTGEELYFVGLPISDQSAEIAAGSLAGATATRPGLDLSTMTDFTDRLLEINPALTEFRYAAESYDAVVLAALAALAANDTSGVAIAAELQEVSGGSGGGEKATTFEQAARVILEGNTVDYDGPSGRITFDQNGDPSDAVIGLFAYGADNGLTRID
ncbi:branched-chain amino acid transport system substrate-binding protein [Salinibacterium sp. CAN_S4]|uniref:ABC transporter substrate-binding protein n=1 Tax=Salinibacterium sp. CAN_S4 TaxID=2787727 RepID=UPI001A1D88CA